MTDAGPQITMVEVYQMLGERDVQILLLTTALMAAQAALAEATQKTEGGD